MNKKSSANLIRCEDASMLVLLGAPCLIRARAAGRILFATTFPSLSVTDPVLAANDSPSNVQFISKGDMIPPCGIPLTLSSFFRIKQYFSLGNLIASSNLVHDTHVCFRTTFSRLILRLSPSVLSTMLVLRIW